MDMTTSHNHYHTLARLIPTARRSHWFKEIASLRSYSYLTPNAAMADSHRL